MVKKLTRRLARINAQLARRLLRASVRPHSCEQPKRATQRNQMRTMIWRWEMRRLVSASLLTNLISSGTVWQQFRLKRGDVATPENNSSQNLGVEILVMAFDSISQTVIPCYRNEFLHSDLSSNPLCVVACIRRFNNAKGAELQLDQAGKPQRLFATKS